MTLKRKPKRRFSWFSIKLLIPITIITAMIFGYLLIKPNGKEHQYRQLINYANQFIEKGEYQKAAYYLAAAKKIKNNQDIQWLLESVADKQRKKMIADFEALKKLLQSSAAKIEKIEKCKDFLILYQTIPGNHVTAAIVAETNKIIAQLQAGSKNDGQ